MQWMAILIAGFLFISMRADARTSMKMRIFLLTSLTLAVAWVTMSTAVPELLATGGGG